MLGMVDRQRIQQELNLARRALKAGERQIALQAQIVSDTVLSGRDPAPAQTALGQLRNAQAVRVIEFDHLVSLLNLASATGK